MVFGAVGDLDTYKSIVSPLVDAFRGVRDAANTVKAGFLFLREKYQQALQLVQRIFGPRAHRLFPKRYRECSSSCGCGIYPTKGNGRYTEPGVDVVAGGPGTVIVAPFDGIIKGDPAAKTVTLQPNSFFLRNVEVIMHHVRPMPNVTAGGRWKDKMAVLSFHL